MKKIIFTRIGQFLAVILSSSLLILSITYAISTFAPRDVLKNWTLSGVNKSYKIGDEIQITSSSNKVMDVTGISQRFLKCTYDGTQKNIEVPGSDATRPIGQYSREFGITIPSEPFTHFPQECYVYIEVTYNVRGQAVIYTARTTSFTVEQR